MTVSGEQEKQPEKPFYLQKGLSFELIGELDDKDLLEGYGAMLLRNPDGEEVRKPIPITPYNQDFFFNDSKRGGLYRMAKQGSAMIVSLIDLSMQGRRNNPESSQLRGLSFIDRQGECTPYAFPLELDLVRATEEKGMVYKEHTVTMLTVQPEQDKIKKEIFSIDDIAVVAASKYILCTKQR